MTKPLPTISLVTPSLNQGKFLKATIDSVLTQECPGVDYFVQDGGSTDETLDVLRSFGNQVAWTSEKDSGQAEAINRGLARARGDVLGYLNSDDVLLPGALRAVAEAFASDPALLLVYGRAFYVDADGKRLGPCLTQEWEPERLGDLCFVTQPAAFWRRRVLEEIGPFDMSLHHTMDYDYWFRIAARYPRSAVRYLDRDLAAARLHAEAKTVAGWERALEEILALVRRRTGRVSLWWLVAKWDHRVDGRSQVLFPHPVPWRAYPPALYEYARLNPLSVWARGLAGSPRGFLKRLRATF